jgi:hypothetical protein
MFAPQDWQRSEDERRAYFDLIAALGPLAPDPLFDILRTLRAREIDLREPGRRAEVIGHVRAGIEAIPELTVGLDRDAVIAANADFRLARTADWVYLTACKAIPGLIDEVTFYTGLDVLAAARAKGPVILAAFHFGPSEMLVGGIARRGIPVTVVISDASRRPGRGYYSMMRESSGTDNIEVANNGSLGVLLSCLHALRAGRAVMVFPELSFTTASEPRVGVPFGERTVYVPQGIAALAAKTSASVLPCHVERRGPGRYRCVIADPLPAGLAGKDLMAALFAHCEALIRDGLAADWEIWPLVPHMLREPSLSKEPSA